MCWKKNSCIHYRIAILVGMILIIGCSSKPSSMGKEGSMLIVADPLDIPIIRPEIERMFGKTIHTPQLETEYRMSWIDAEELTDYTSAPLVLLATTIDGKGPTAKLLRKMLSPSILEGVNSGEYVIFKKLNTWSRPQLLLIVLGRNQTELGENITEWSDSLFAWADGFKRDRVFDQLFRKGEQRDIEKYIAGKYGYKLKVMHDYLIAQENDSLDFIRLIRHYPERWIMVATGELEQGLDFDAQFIYDRRKLISNSFLDPVMTYDENWSAEDVMFSGMEAILIRGVWATVGPTGGGPYFCYGLKIPNSNNYCLIDGAVFFPGEQKIHLLWQLEIIAKTFEVSLN